MKNEINNYDVIVVGASLGGTLAAYSAAKNNLSVLLTEETDWIGGQLTSQAVPPDEHRYIEYTGCSASYRAYRNSVRNVYRQNPYFSDEIKSRDFFCPAGSTVSRLSHPPKLAHKLLLELIAPLQINGTLTLKTNTVLTSCVTSGDEITSLFFNEDGARYTAKLYIDGTDTGELVEKSGTEFVTGAESRIETGEPHAPLTADPFDMQPVTWVAAAKYDSVNESDAGEKSENYDYFRNLKMPYDRYNVFSMFGENSSTGKAKKFGLFPSETDERGNKLFALMPYRRIVNSAYFSQGEPCDVTLINWPQNDYFLDNVFLTSNDKRNKLLARSLTECFVYYLRTECGLKGLSLDKTALGTKDGLAQAPYIRESRRIKAEFTIKENDVAAVKGRKTAKFFDSAGVGFYNIDLHITTRSHSFFYLETVPFEIPFGAFVPVRMKNLIPACKNIGTTHLTNGCFRTHPTEWNIGETAGLSAVYALNRNVTLNEIRNNGKLLTEFQNFLTDSGVMLHWEI